MIDKTNKRLYHNSIQSAGKRALLAMVAMGLAAGCASEPTKEQQVSQIQQEYSQIAASMVVDSEDPINRTIDFNQLRETNPEVIGWIYIPETQIDYPILQSEDDEKYLTTDLKGNESEAGSIYIEKYNNADFSDPVTLMYGHTVFGDDEQKLEAMFSDLHLYENPDFLAAHPYIYIYTPQKTMKFQVFSAVTFDDRYILGNYQFRDPEDFQDYLDEIRNTPGAITNMEVPVSQDTKILTLSTCVGLDSQQRWLVNATQVEEVKN